VPWCTGQQITCAYNNGPNEVFLYRYGFVEIGNPHDVYEAPSLLQRIRAVELIPHSRFQRLKDLGLEDALSPARHFSLECSPTDVSHGTQHSETALPIDMLAQGSRLACLGLQLALALA